MFLRIIPIFHGCAIILHIIREFKIPLSCLYFQCLRSPNRIIPNNSQIPTGLIRGREKKSRNETGWELWELFIFYYYIFIFILYLPVFQPNSTASNNSRIVPNSVHNSQFVSRCRANLRFYQRTDALTSFFEIREEKQMA
jgi:hypothetical protein